uniref:DUF7596 domain-containing protein n=1 Tax=Ditylenchus dipsaci TaxID=166011 RepID=A0A915DAL6_9BILA
MLAKAQLQHLVKSTKTNRVLDGNLLPLNNNECFLNLEEVSSVTVVEDDPKGAVPVAFGIFNRCSSNQIYCSIVAVSPNYEHNFVNAEKVKCKTTELGLTGDTSSNQHSLLKLTEVMSELPDLSGLPQYFSAFAEPVARPLLTCVVDQLIEQTVGNQNVEMGRNFIDLYDSEAGLPEHSDALWRDYSGFVVADRFRYCEINIARNDLLDVIKSSLEKNSATKQILQDDGTFLPYRIESISKATLGLVTEYDQSVALMSRDDYLEYLVGLGGVSGKVAIDAQNQPQGYILTLNSRVLQCYGENVDVANHLLVEHISENIKTHQLSLFVRLGKDDWIAEKLVAVASKVRRVRRFHTRIVPASVKWNKVYSLNMGVHLL